MTPRLIGAAQVEKALDYRRLIDKLREMLRAGCVAPPRHHHTIAVPGAPAATLLLMPAWQPGRYLGVKSATVFPGNAARGLASVLGVYLLLDATTGEPLALIDARSLTLRRTAAASALAADYLARRDARRLLLVGTGALAPHMARAHACVRGIGEITVWGRTPEKARALAAALADCAPAVRASTDLAAAARRADIICCATMASEPLIRGEWLAPGTHLDLVGAFRPTMRESDDEAVRRSRVYVDSRAGALAEGGDLALPIASGAITPSHVVGELAELARGSVAGRGDAAEITLFKSVGMALEDLAAAELVYEAERAS